MRAWSASLHRPTAAFPKYYGCITSQPRKVRDAQQEADNSGKVEAAIPAGEHTTMAGTEARSATRKWRSEQPLR
eukprot:750411-Hanusia_phi.AAC.1